MKEIGRVTHYFPKINVCVIELTDGELKLGDEVRIKGATTDHVQEVTSMQIDHKNVDSAKAGDALGIKVDDHVRENDHVYLNR